MFYQKHFLSDSMPLVLICCLLFSFIFTIPSVSAQSCCAVNGDVNHSSMIDISDLTFLVNYMFQNGPAPVCLEEADLNYDNSIDITDLINLIDYLFRGYNLNLECSSITIWDPLRESWVTKIDATSFDEYVRFSFLTKEITTDPNLWDIGFKREEIILNGGVSSTGGSVLGSDLDVVAFDNITIADTLGESWMEDITDYEIRAWFYYNVQTHALDISQNVFCLVDAEGDNYIKFQIDSLIGMTSWSMGKMFLTYYYQPIYNSRNLAGVPQQVSFQINSDTVYFDFSSGQIISPDDPKNSLEWDIRINDYIIFQNSGPNGIGYTATYKIFYDLIDPTDINAVGLVSDGIPFFKDQAASALVAWYKYIPVQHLISSNNHVYFIHSDEKVYKIIIESYYYDQNNNSGAGHYTFRWKEL